MTCDDCGAATTRRRCNDVRRCAGCAATRRAAHNAAARAAEAPRPRLRGTGLWPAVRAASAATGIPVQTLWWRVASKRLALAEAVAMGPARRRAA